MEWEVKDIEISSVNIYDSNKAGDKFMTKAGKPFKKVNFKIDPSVVSDDSFEGWVSMLDFDGKADSWTDGDKISGKVIHNGDFWNFELPRVNLAQEIEDLKTRVSALESNTGASKPKEIDGDKKLEDMTVEEKAELLPF